ncbi:hypothetical protein FRX31_024074, partial [Thalictrum thalictroides]
MSITRVLIASDSKNAVLCLKGEQVVPWYTRETIQEIQEMCQRLEDHTFIHVFKETNQAADYLAGIVGPKGIVKALQLLTKDLNEIVHKDKNNVVFTET